MSCFASKQAGLTRTRMVLMQRVLSSMSVDFARLVSLIAQKRARGKEEEKGEEQTDAAASKKNMQREELQ